MGLGYFYIFFFLVHRCGSAVWFLSLVSSDAFGVFGFFFFFMLRKKKDIPTIGQPGRIKRTSDYMR